MCELVSRHGLGFVPPSFDEIKGKYLMEEVKLTREALEEHRAIWKIKGCTIMVDGWTDPKKRNILNIFVNNPRRTFFLNSVDTSNVLESPNKLFKMMDDIVEEVGEENVVQIVTDNTTYYKVAGEMLMAKRTRLYWTPCATHRIEMILEDYEKIPIQEETITKAKRVLAFIYSRASLIPRLQHFTKGIYLVKQGIACCATSYLTLGCIHENEGALRRMFTSKEWKSSWLAKTRNGKYVEDMVLDTVFWENVMTCFKSAHPLVEVLRLVSSIEEPATGFIYEAMEQAKEEIRKSLSKGVIESFMPPWEIIHEKLDKQIHSPLHAAGYFLNPKFHYSPGFRGDNKVKHGLQNCITRLVPDPEERAKIEIQLDDFDKRADLLGHPMAIMVVDKRIPSHWWDSFGDGQPELKKFAMRVLSLTCSSHGGEHNQSAFETVHTKRRNHLRQKTDNDVVFVMTNSKLAEKKQS